MIQSILSNLAIILLLHLIMSQIMDSRNKISTFTFHALTIIQLEGASTLLHTVNKADINLYKAKTNGRNRFVGSY
ncbi:hypothetical protein D1B33_15995 [Lysinibacillus yapensis]|uniref:Diguanylate cyclase n=1 Tax=Ureibacillus yapensis TaxID=2304605 RepID=A0A396SIU0_9BACL|nr:hypothetical protein [Lysinibacillus yapensis]RHW33243.1 hypothetical protein D1B33_15995 [Lysinibacillus yapensis]